MPALPANVIPVDQPQLTSLLAGRREQRAPHLTVLVVLATHPPLHRADGRLVEPFQPLRTRLLLRDVHPLSTRVDWRPCEQHLLLLAWLTIEPVERSLDRAERLTRASGPQADHDAHIVVRKSLDVLVLSVERIDEDLHGLLASGLKCSHPARLGGMAP